MTLQLGTVWTRSGNELGDFLPHLAGALALLIIGVIVVRLLARALTKALKVGGVDRHAERAGVNAVLERAGLGSSLASVVGRAIGVALTIVVIFAALSLLGLGFLSDSLNQGVQELPRLLIAAALVLTGLVLGGLVAQWGDRLSEQMDLPVSVGRIAQIAVVSIFGLMALAQISVPTTVLLLLLGILVAGATATLTLAFGLGARDVARALSAGRYLRQHYVVGQEIGFADVRGTVATIESTSVTLDEPEGLRVRIPNHLLLENVVTIYSDPPRTNPEAVNNGDEHADGETDE